MNRRMSFAAAVLILSGVGGLLIHPASAQSLSGNQVISNAPGGSYMFNQGQCTNGANGTILCSGPPAALIAPQGTLVSQGGVITSSPLLASEIGAAPDNSYSYQPYSYEEPSTAFGMSPQEDESDGG